MSLLDCQTPAFKIFFPDGTHCLGDTLEAILVRPFDLIAITGRPNLNSSIILF
jgi:hypothetical protein